MEALSHWILKLHRWEPDRRRLNNKKICRYSPHPTWKQFSVVFTGDGKRPFFSALPLRGTLLHSKVQLALPWKWPALRMEGWYSRFFEDDPHSTHGWRHSGRRDYFLTQSYTDLSITSSEVRKGSLHWTPMTKTLTFCIWKVVPEQKLFQTIVTHTRFRTRFLIKSEGHSTPPVAALVTTWCPREAAAQLKHLVAQLFPPTPF